MCGEHHRRLDQALRNLRQAALDAARAPTAVRVATMNSCLAELQGTLHAIWTCANCNGNETELPLLQAIAEALDS